MSQTQTRKTVRGPASIGVGWRAFQVAGLVTAVSWLLSYFVFHDAYGLMLTIFALENPLGFVFGMSYLLSPVLSLVLIGIAVWPGALAVLNRDDWVALGARGALLVVPTLWLLAGFLGGSNSMVNQMLTHPMGSSETLPVAGGNLFHLVFQHWFQGFSAILLALVPAQFATLTNSDRPAGTGAVVRDVTAQMELEQRLAALHEATRAMMNADRPGEVANIGAQAADEVLDIPYSRIHLRDEETDELVPAAWTGDTERVLEGAPPTVDPDSGLVWETFRDGEANFYHNFDGLEGEDAQETPLESSLLLPLGEHGIMLVQATEPAAFSDAKIELAHVLSANTQAALARTERERELELVRALLDHSSDGVFVIDPETGAVLDTNDPACDQLGYARNELRSMTVDDILVGVDGRAGSVADADIDVDAVLQTVADRGIVTLQGEHRRKDGSTLPVQLTLNHLDLDRAYLVAIARDVTDRRERQRELAARREELELLGLVQTLVDQVVRSVLGPTTREEIELQACEVLSDSPFYADAWLVDPGQGQDQDGVTIGPWAETADGGKLRTVDDMTPEAPATAGLQETMATGGTQVLEGVPGESIGVDSGADGEPTAPEHPDRADETAVALPLTYGESNYGALVVIADRPDAFGDRERSALETLAVALAFVIHVRATESTPRPGAVELEFEYRGPDSTSALFTRLAAALACRVRLDGLVPAADGGVRHYYVADTDAPADEVREVVGATDGVEDYHIIEQDDQTCLFEVRGGATDMLDSLVDAGAVVRTAEAGPDDGPRLVVDILPDEDPGPIRATVHGADADWTQTARRRVDRPMGRVRAACDALENSLTDRQREALLTAYFAGYYDTPRASTAQDVANMLAIADSTLFQHLQAAQRKVIEAWVDPNASAVADRTGP